MLGDDRGSPGSRGWVQKEVHPLYCLLPVSLILPQLPSSLLFWLLFGQASSKSWFCGREKVWNN